MSVSVTLCVVVPPVAALRVNPRMARLAECDEVSTVVRPTLRERQPVVYLLGLCIDPFLKAELTQRMSCCVAVTGALPSASIPTAYSRIAVVLLVAFVFLLLMFFTEALPILHKLRTTGVRAGVFRFSRQ